MANLNDSGPGSLRQAMEVEKGPRVVVLRVSGTILLNSSIGLPSDDKFGGAVLFDNTNGHHHIEVLHSDVLELWR